MWGRAPTVVSARSAAAGLFVAALAWVIRGAIIHLSSMALGGTSAWGPTFAVGVWSMLPFFFRDLLQTAYVLLRGQLIEHQGLSFLVASGDWLKDSYDLLYSFLGNVGPFSLWHIILLSIGIAVATKISAAKATVTALVVWGIFTALKLLPVAIGATVGQGLLG